MVNARRVNIASYNVKAGDEVSIKDKPKSRQLVVRNLDLTQIAPVPDWLTVDRDLRRESAGKVGLDTVLSRFRDCCLPAYRAWRPEDFVARLDDIAWLR
jgi:ribosomal protein S4